MDKVGLTGRLFVDKMKNFQRQRKIFLYKILALLSSENVHFSLPACDSVNILGGYKFSDIQSLECRYVRVFFILT